MEFNTDIEWLRQKAKEEEEAGFVSVGGLISDIRLLEDRSGMKVFQEAREENSQ